MLKDFYDMLPSCVCETLDELIEDYGSEEWFGKAWNEYRNHIRNCDSRYDMRMPGFIFNNYVNK